jgi:cytochrome oxidase Cu insertion factor (SCO1/SenC/PrrC family)
MGKKRTVWPLFFLALVFLVPIVAAYFWVPTRFGNYGELVVPARPIADVPLQSLSGESLNFSDLQKKWTLLMLDPGTCNDNCKKTVHAVHQIRQAQAKDLKRLQLVLIVQKNYPVTRSFLSNYTDFKVVTGEASAIQSLVDQFSLKNGDRPLTKPGRVYVVDPAGNFMMYYPEDMDGNLIWKDLRRLLKVSQIG